MAGRYRDHYPIRRVSRVIPWGYKVSEEDPDLLVPDKELMKLLDIAARAWEHGSSSQMDIAAWLSIKSGWPISRMGLKKRLTETEAKLLKRAIKPSKRD